MRRNSIVKYLGIICIALITACSVPFATKKTENKSVPSAFASKDSTRNTTDSTNTASVKWKSFFKDPYLAALIDTALNNNQELNITMQEINIARSEVKARKGEYLPFIGLEGAAGLERPGRYTRDGSVEENLEVAPGKAFPDPMTDYLLAANVSWEVDIWKKLRNAKKAATSRYLASIEGKNFMVTRLISEIASSYYELLALDNQLDIVKQNIEIQSNALEIVKQQKQAARVTELAVRKFEAEVFYTRSLQFNIQQKIVETENRINFLVGRFPQPVQRNAQTFNSLTPDTVLAGIPSQLLANRPDIRQAEYDLVAAKLDVRSTKANFYPNLDIRANIGYNAFNPSYLVRPESMIYSVAGGLVAPLINRNAIKAAYWTANAKQVQAVYNYERTILNAYIEVVNQMANINNLAQSYDLKQKRVIALTESIDISTVLFKSARADYMEVLMTQRDALESRFELVETKMQQMNAVVNIYRSLGGGWK